MVNHTFEKMLNRGAAEPELVKHRGQLGASAFPILVERKQEKRVFILKSIIKTTTADAQVVNQVLD